MFKIKVFYMVSLFQIFSNFDFQWFVGIAANKNKIMLAHQKHHVCCCFKGRHGFSSLCCATYEVKAGSLQKLNFLPLMPHLEVEKGMLQSYNTTDKWGDSNYVCVNEKTFLKIIGFRKCCQFLFGFFWKSTTLQY